MGGKASLLRSVAPHIRFGPMETKYFIEKVQPTACLSNQEMLEISNYILVRREDPGYQCDKFCVKKRISDVIVIKRVVVDKTDEGCYTRSGQDAIALTGN